MAEDFAPEQQGPGTPAATDPIAKRAKFLTSFAALDPEAALDEQTLGGILADPAKRDEFTSYVSKLNPDFQMNGQELADALGYGADVKKKPGTLDSGTGSPPAPTAQPPASGFDSEGQPLPPLMRAGDQEFVSVDPTTQLPTAGPTGVVEVGAVGTPLSNAYVGPLGAPLSEQRGVAPSTPGDPNSEQAQLDALPTVPLNAYPKLLGTQPTQVEDDSDLVALPADYKGGLPTGLQQDDSGNQYFRRPISNKVDGKEQTRAQAFGTSFVNASTEILQGVAEGAQALGNVAEAGNQALGITQPLTFGTEASQSLENTKGQLAPIYTAPGRQNLNTITAQAGALAPIVLAQIAQTVAPQTRLPVLLKGAISLLGTVAFDAPIIHGARERAKAAGLEGTAADTYTVFEAALTLGAFKLGGKLINQGGDAAVLKLAPKEFSESVARDATQRTVAMEAQLGRALTQQEQQTALAESLKEALPGLAKFAKGTAQQAVTLPLAGTATTIGNQVGARALGGTPQPVTAESFLQDRGRDALAGLVMGGATEGVAAGLDAAGGLVKAAPVESQAEKPLFTVLGDYTADEPVLSLHNAEVVGPGSKPNTFIMRGVDDNGVMQEREAHDDSLMQNLPGERTTPPSPESSFSQEQPQAPQPEAATVTPLDEPVPSTTATPSLANAEPSAPAPIDAPASAPDAASGPLAAAEPAAEPMPTPAAPQEPLPAAEPHPDHVKALTPQQQAVNNTLDALDRYNALKPGQRKGKEGSTARAEVARAGKKAGIEVTVDKDGKITLAGGKRLTRSNEYTATTPANNHVPLEGRPAEARPFIDAVLAGAETNPTEIQGLGIKMRGKELSGRELADAVKDIRAGRDTLRAQLVLDTLENAHRAGYLEKSTGTGLATEKMRVPADAYLGEKPSAGEEIDLSDTELDDMLAQDPMLADAIATYTDPETGEIDYAKLAAEGGRGALETFFDVAPDVSAKITALANERASQTPDVPNQSRPNQNAAGDNGRSGIQRGPVSFNEGDALAAGLAPGGTEPAGAAAGSPGQEAPAAPAEVAPAAPAPTLAEQNIAAKQEFNDALAEFRAARKKGSGLALSSVTGIPTFSAEEVAALTKMVKAAIKRGSVKTKMVIAELRALGFTDDDGTDAQLRPVIKQILTDEGVRQSKPPKEAPQTPIDPTNTKERQGAVSIEKSGLSDELSQGLRDRGTNLYTPKPLAETKAHVDRIIATEGIDRAYYTATHAGTEHPKDVMEVLRIQVMAHYDGEVRRLSADPTANAEAIADAIERAGKVADVYVAGGTEDGRALRARQMLQEYAPSVTVARLGNEINKVREQETEKLRPKAQRITKKINKEAVDETLVDGDVRKVREKVAGPQPITSKERLADIRSERSKLFDQLRALHKTKPTVAYSTVVPITPQMAAAGAIHVKIFGTYIAEGLVHARALVDRLKREAGPAVAGTPDELLMKQAAAALGDHKEAVRQGIASMGTTLEKIARDHLTDPAATGKTLAEKFVEGAGLDPADAKTYAAAVEKKFADLIAAKRKQILDNTYSRKVRVGQTRPAQDVTDRVRKLYALAPNDENAVLGLIAEQAKLPELTKADNTKLYQLAQAITDAKGDNAKAHAVQNFHLAVKGIRGLTGWEQVKTVMYANMLSGIGTQLKNVNSTGLNTASDLFYATGWSAFLSVQQSIRNGSWRLSNSQLSLDGLRLATAPLRGVFNRSGADRAVQMLRTGVRPPGYEGKFDEASDLEVMAQLPAKSAIGVARKAYANMAKYIPRALGANDLMWSGGAEQMWAYNIALTDALREGRNLPTDQIWASVNERLYGTTVRLADAQAQATQELGTSGGGTYRMRVQELMEASRDQRLAAESKRAAAETTFNGPMEGFIGDVMSKLGRLTEAETGRGYQPLKGIVPFTRIVANVTNAFLNYTPVGAIRAAKGKIGYNGNAFERQYSPMERSVVAAKAVTGMVVMAAAYQLLKDDELTGAGPSDPAANRAWQQRGHKPYNIAGFNYKDSPWYYPLASVAALKEAQAFDGADFDNDQLFAKRAARMVVATTQASFASLSLTNLQDFMNALSDPSKGKDPAERLGRYVQRTAGAVASSVLLPASGLLRGASRMGQQFAGSTKVEANDVWGMVGQDVPFARENLPKVYDQLGNEVPVGSTVPFMPVPEIKDDSGATKRINEFLDKHNLFIPDINRYQSDMQVLKGRVGDLGEDEKSRMRTMTDTERKKYLLSRLGGEAPMPAQQWQEFYPKRGRLIKEQLLLHLPELEAMAESNPRRLRKTLNRYYRKATKNAKKGIDFSDPDVLPSPEAE